MSFAPGELLKGATFYLAGLGSITSGFKLAALTKPETIKEFVLTVEEEDVSKYQDQYEGVAKSRQTWLVEYEGTNLFTERSLVTNKPDKYPSYFYDHLHNLPNQERISYIVNRNGDNIRVSNRKPQTPPEGSIYYGWKLNTFKHTNMTNLVLYGFCAPESEFEISKRECDHLPEGWTVQPV